MSNKERFVLIETKKGVTLTELLITVGILIILITIAIPVIYSFQKESDLNDEAEEIINILRLAQNKTLASEKASQWGVCFSTTTSPHQYTLFRGANYAARATASDEIYKLPKNVEFSDLALNGGEEVVFDKLVGTTEQFGKVSLILKDTPAKTRTIYIESSGLVRTSTSSVSDEERLKDSRHVHIDYSSDISTSTEKLILTFEGGTTKDIVIADNMKGGQIYWQGEVDVGGELQVLKIHTHRLNDPDTQFCIHRDQRYNTKALDIDIDGVTLIQYTANGLTTEGSSDSISNLTWQ